MCKNFDTRKDTTGNADFIEDAGKIKLEPARMWGKGVIEDFKRTVGTHWCSEMINFNQKTVAVSLLLFISVIAPTLTFGAVYERVTGHYIGAIETIIGTAWIGIAYSLLGGMPVAIKGSTGPLLAMTTALYNISSSIDVPFLTFNAWVSIWLFFYLILAGFFDVTRFVLLATRFTDDIFAMIIVMIFVLDAIGDPFSQTGLLHYLNPDHKWHEANAEDPNYDYMSVALLSLIVGIGTTATTFFFRSFKFSSFFCSQGIRTSLYDFAVSLSVIIWTLVAQLGFKDIKLEEFNVPDSIEPTFSCCTSACDSYWPEDCPDKPSAAGTRSWFVNLFDLNGKTYVPFLAAGPAVLAFVLCFLDNGITWHLINNKNNKLQHGESYSYDLCLNGIFNGVNGLLGLPWMVATTVPCIIHLNGLADKAADGSIISVQETRLTSFFAHVIMMTSIFYLNVLQMIPLAVLYGVFLFMGLSALGGIQFWNRILLWFQQSSKYPETIYTKYMKKKRIHLYTCLELLFFAGVFTVLNVKTISIAFPLMTLLCIPGRLFFVSRFMEGWELVLLDGEDDDIQEWIEAKEEYMLTGTMEAGVVSKGDFSVNVGSTKEFDEIEIESMAESEA